MPFNVVDDGFDTVHVGRPDGETDAKVIDVYALARRCITLNKELKAEGVDLAEYPERLAKMFEANGLPGLSSKAADDLGAQLIRRMSADEKKSQATPPPG